MKFRSLITATALVLSVGVATIVRTSMAQPAAAQTSSDRADDGNGFNPGWLGLLGLVGLLGLRRRASGPDQGKKIVVPLRRPPPVRIQTRHDANRHPVMSSETAAVVE
ncbi:MAG: WGxxGxxG family protein [Candidatus Binatia bacterium]